MADPSLGTAIDPRFMPTFGGDVAARPTPNALVAGLGSGFHELLGLGGSALQGAGSLLGSPGMEQAGSDFAATQARIAQRVGRPDLEGLPTSFGELPSWLAYQGAKAAPTIAGFIGAGIAAPEAAVPAALARAGAVLPEFLGGGGLAAGASTEASEAAAKVGMGFAKQVVGGAAFGLPLGFGQMIQSAAQKPGGLTSADAAQALALSPVSAAVNLLTPEFLRGTVAAGATGKIAGMLLSKTINGAALGAVQSGLQTAIEQTFRPDISPDDKIHNIVDSVVTGGAVGGLFGGSVGTFAAMRGVKTANPVELANNPDTVNSVIDQVTQPQQPPLQLPSPSNFVYANTDAAGRTWVSGRPTGREGAPFPVSGDQGEGIDVLNATPRDTNLPPEVQVPQAPPSLFAPNAVTDRGTVEGSTITVGRRGDDGRFTSEPTAVEQPPVADDTARAFRNFTTPELEAAANALVNKREAQGGLPKEQNDIAQAIDAEIALRRNSLLTSNNINQSAAGAVEREDASRRGTGEQDSNVPAPAKSPDWDSERNDLLQGISTRKNYVDATDRNALISTLQDRLTNGSSAKGDMELAKRLGIDTNAPAAPVEAQGSRVQEQAGAPSVGEKFTSQWRADTKSVDDPAVQALKPTSMADAQMQIYHALGDKGVKSDSDSLETLAQKYGILDDQKQLTPLAQDIAKHEPISTEEAVKAARAQDFKGADASQFDKGVRDYLADAHDPSGGDAYQAGHQWAEERNSIPEGALKKYDPKSQLVGDVTDRQVDLINGEKPQPETRTVPPEVRQGQLVNEAIDNAGLTPAKNESDIAALKRMVTQGDLEGAMEGLARLRRGESLFQEPDRAPPPPFKGETVTPGAPKAQVGADLVPTKAATRAEAEVAIRKYEVSQAIETAYQNGQIDDRTRLSLINQMRQGKINEVAKVVGPIEPVKSASPLRDATARAAQRATIRDQLAEAMRQAGVEGEVPELNVNDRGQLMERQGETGAQPMSGADAQKVVDQARGKFRNDTTVEVHNSMADVPPMLRDQLSSDNVLGFHDSGSNTIHIIAGNHSAPEEVRATLYHELLGHQGLRAAFGDKLDSLLGNIYRTNKGMQKLADAYLARTGKWSDLPDSVRQRNAVEEIMAEGSEFGVVKSSMWEKLTNMVRSFGRKMGLDIGYNNADVQAIIARAHEAIVDGTDVSGGRVDTSPAQINERARTVVSRASEALDRFEDRTDLKGRALDAQLYFADKHHIVEKFSQLFKRPNGSDPMHDSERVERQRSTIVAKVLQPGTDAVDAVGRVINKNKAIGEKIPWLMTGTEFPFDYTHPWTEQSEAVRKMPQLQAEHERYNNMYRGLSPEARQAHDDLRAFNDTQMIQYQSALLHMQVAADASAAHALSKTIDNTPVDEFFNDQVTELDNYLTGLRHGKDALTLKAMKEQLAPLDERLAEARSAIDKLADKPYFHLGRFGEHFVDFRVKDQAALATITDALEGKGFRNVISPTSEQTHVFARFESKVQHADFVQAIEPFKKGDDPLITQSRIGTLSDEKYSNQFVDKGINRLIGSIEQSNRFDDVSKKEMVSSLRKIALDLMPENSITRVMTHRNNIPGYDADMLRSFAQRAKLGADSLSNLTTAPKTAAAFTEMRSMIQAAQEKPTSEVSLDQRRTMQKAVDELNRRLQERGQWGHSKYLDLLSRISSTHYLGLSPGFVVTLLSQLGQLTLPQLGAMHGFARSFSEMAKATPLAFRIMRQVYAEGNKISFMRGMDAVITRDALVNTSGMNARLADVLMHLVNTGRIDLGGQIREMVRTAEGRDSKIVENGMRVASSLGYYTETMTRLIAAIASHNLDGEGMALDKAAERAGRVVDETLFNYSPDNWGRAFGRGPSAMLGRFTPLMTKFMQFSAQLTGKLYREVSLAMGHGTQEEQEFARRFLMQHLATMTVLAGTMGLPAVTAMAAAYDWLKDHIDPNAGHPSDIKSDYRQYMSTVFGKELEPILSHGATRAIGVDLNQRLGEQNLVPFSRFLADKRDMKDKLTDLESRSWGAPTTMLTSWANGITKISQGDLLGGLAASLPTVLANQVKSVRMAATGSVTDSKGNTLPLSPSVHDVVVQSMGLVPGQMADYQDRMAAARNAEGSINRQGQLLKNQMVTAMANKDMDTMRALVPQIMAFDRANPTRPSILSSIESGYAGRVKSQEVSAVTKQPIGVRPGAGQYSFGDISFAAH